MTIIGTSGSNSDGPLPPENRLFEPQKGVFVQLPREMLGIVADPLMMKMISTEENTRSGHFKAQAGKPTLLPISYMRTASLPEEPQEVVWKANYEEFLGVLPEDARLRLGQEMALPPEARNLHYVALQNLMEACAKGLVWLERREVSPTSGSTASERLRIQQALPYLAAAEGMRQNKESVSFVRNLLSEIGPNHPQYGAMSEWCQRSEEANQLFEGVVQRVFDGKGDEDSLKEIRGLAHSLGEISAQWRGRSGGELFAAQITVASLLAHCLARGTEISPSFFFGLGIADLGFAMSKEEVPLRSMADGFSSLFSAKAGDEEGVCRWGFALGLVSLGSLLFMGAVYLGEKGLSAAVTQTRGLGGEEEQGVTLPLLRQYESHLTSIALLSSAILVPFADLLEHFISTSSDRSPLFADSLLLMVTFMTALGVGGGGTDGMDRAGSFLSAMAPYVEGALARVAEQLVDRGADGVRHLIVAYRALKEGDERTAISSGLALGGLGEKEGFSWVEEGVRRSQSVLQGIENAMAEPLKRGTDLSIAV